VLADEIISAAVLVRAGLEALSAIVRVVGERSSRRFIEFFTAAIRNRNTRLAYVCAVKQFFDWCDDPRGLKLVGIEVTSTRRRARSPAYD
jgi:hypothetical protein